VRKSGPLGERQYHYDEAGRLLAESAPNGIHDREYIYLGELPVAAGRLYRRGRSAHVFRSRCAWHRAARLFGSAARIAAPISTVGLCVPSSSACHAATSAR